jgi:hypothetical protein
MQTERVTFLTSRDHKAALDAYAARTGQSVGNVVREATSRYLAQPSVANDEEASELAELSAIVREVAKAVPDMQASLERTAKMMEDTIEDVDRKLRAAGIRK